PRIRPQRYQGHFSSKFYRRESGTAMLSALVVSRGDSEHTLERRYQVFRVSPMRESPSQQNWLPMQVKPPQPYQPLYLKNVAALLKSDSMVQQQPRIRRRPPIVYT